MLHGPYFWLVSYISKKSTDKRRGKYSWRYLGKNPTEVWNRLELFDERFSQKYNLIDLNTKLHKILQIRKETLDTKTLERVLTVDEV